MENLKVERPYVVWYKDLEDFVEEKLSIRPRLFNSGEYSNDSFVEVEAMKVELNNGITDQWLEDYEQAIVDFLAGELPEIDLEMLLAFLATKNLIEEGKYLIKIWW